MLLALCSLRHALCFKVWLGWEDSNLRIQVPKTCVLPLDDTPIFFSAMSNFKAHTSNEIQSPNKMPKQVRHDKNVILNSFQNLFLNFDIHLTLGFWHLKLGYLFFEFPYYILLKRRIRSSAGFHC